MSKAIGLPFKSELVPKVLSGEKTQSRRLPGMHNCRLFDFSKPRYISGELGAIPIRKDVTGKMRGLDWNKIFYGNLAGIGPDFPKYFYVWHSEDRKYYVLLPRHESGDIAWMRENHRFVEHEDGQDFIQYLADGVECPIPNVREYCDYTVGKYNRNRPSIHMPRWACREEMVLTGVRIELIQDISEEDAIAEGIVEEEVIIGCTGAGGTHRELNGIRYDSGSEEWEHECAVDAFAELWDSINAKRGWAWSKNRPVIIYQW